MGTADDRLDIIELIHRYAAAIDLKLYDSLEDVFAADAVADYSSMRTFVGDDCTPQGLADIRRWLEHYTGTRASMHFMHNHVVTLNGDTASMRNYMHNTNSSIAGVYHTTAVRTSAGWRLASLRLDERVIDESRVENPHRPR